MPAADSGDIEAAFNDGVLVFGRYVSDVESLVTVETQYLEPREKPGKTRGRQGLKERLGR